MTYRIGYLRFALWFTGLTIGIPVLLNLIRSYADLDLDSSAVSIIPMMIASMLEGTQFARAEQRHPEGKEAWAITLRLTGVALVISLAFGAVMIALMPAGLPQIGLAVWAALSVGAALLFWGLGRLFFGMGAKNELKAAKRAAQKAADSNGSPP